MLVGPRREARENRVIPKVLTPEPASSPRCRITRRNSISRLQPWMRRTSFIGYKMQGIKTPLKGNMSRQTNPQFCYVLGDSDLYFYACKFPSQPFEHIDVGKYVWWLDRMLAFNH